jgi:hypothetical protein
MGSPRHDTSNQGAGGRGRLDIEVCADDGGAVLHDAQAQAAAFIVWLGRDADAVILDAQF